MLDGSLTIDHRLLTKSGRAEIIQQQKDLPQNAEIIGKMTAAGVTSLGVATASLAIGDSNLKQAYDTVMNPAKTFDFVQKHPEAATVLEQFKNGNYDGLLATKGSIQILAQALGQDVNVLTTSITSYLNIKGAYDHQTDTVVLDVNNENRSSILNTTGHEIAHGQGIKNETLADLVGKSVDWAFNSGVKNNQDTIDQYKVQLGDGKDAATQLKNNKILTKDNHKAIDNIVDHSDEIDEKTTILQDKDLLVALSGCAKNFSLDCASSKYTYYKTLDGNQSLAYLRGYDKAVDQMIADAKNLPKNVREALILIKDDPKAFGAAMLQALKEMPAEYQDKAKKVVAAKYNAKTPAEFEAAGKAELELKVEMGSFMLGGVGAVKTGAKAADKVVEVAQVLKEKYIIYKTQQGLQIKMRPTHLSEVDGLTQKKGVSGGHNSVEFYDAVKQYDIKIESATPTGVKGITKIEYRIPAKHPQTGEVTHYKGDGKDPFTKTVYDPKIYTDAKMLDLGKQAAAKGYKDAMFSKNGQATSIVNGVSFRIYVDKATGVVKSYHPN